MIFNSLEYILFFIITFVLYYVVNEKYRYIVLLIASYIFYGFSNFRNLYVLIFITFLSYYCGLLINKLKNVKKKKFVLAIFIILCLSTLLYFKYMSFILKNINTIFSSKLSIENIIVPLGISFFILQAMTYPIDLYRKDVKFEKNILKFSLFISFFPQILSGPIGKSKEMLSQFSKEHPFDLEMIKKGFIIVLYGFFQKLVIADCLSKGIDNVYNNLNNYSGITLLIVVFLYSLQIFFDFASYSNIARGCAKMLGYNLTNNFKNPYFSVSIKEFWSKWHISLSTWFRDYLYFPLGGNRKGNLRTYINLLIVFIISGLWHGAAYTFIIWGLLHGIYQIIERFLHFKYKIKSINIIITFLLVTFAWIFFRANNLSDAIYVIKNMFNISFNNINKQILSIGLDKYDLIVTSISILVLFVIECYNGKNNIYNLYQKLPFVIRSGIIMILLFSIIIFGCYGPGFDNSQFIYLGY